jgi:hypothetical protein
MAGRVFVRRGGDSELSSRHCDEEMWKMPNEDSGDWVVLVAARGLIATVGMEILKCKDRIDNDRNKRECRDHVQESAALGNNHHNLSLVKHNGASARLANRGTPG